MAIFNAQTPDARIAAAEKLLTEFADTEFKAVALQIAAASAQQKNDFEKMVVYAERTLEADPKNYPAMLMLATASPNIPASLTLIRKKSSTAPRSTPRPPWIW